MPFLRYLICPKCKGITEKHTSETPFTPREKHSVFITVDCGPDVTKEFEVGYRLKPGCPIQHYTGHDLR